MVSSPISFLAIPRPFPAIRHQQTGKLLREQHQPQPALATRPIIDNQGQQFTQVSLRYEIVEQADLRGADLRGLHLIQAVFLNCLFEDADFREAHLMSLTFLGCHDLWKAKGLQAACHHGPSVLDRGTLKSCCAGLPDAFLEGVGYGPQEISLLRRLYPDVSHED